MFQFIMTMLVFVGGVAAGFLYGCIFSGHVIRKNINGLGDLAYSELKKQRGE